MMHSSCGCRHCDRRPPDRYPPPCLPPNPPPCPPPRPPKPRPRMDSVMLQKIVDCERRNLPCVHADLELEGLPDCQPRSLVSVRPSGAQPWWSQIQSPACSQQSMIRICIPVCAQVCGGNGQQVWATGTLHVETWAPRAYDPSCRHMLLILPCLRLLCADPGPNGCIFQVQVQVSLEIYVLRYEPYHLRRPEGDCPDLPLYPPPIQPRGW